MTFTEVFELTRKSSGTSVATTSGKARASVASPMLNSVLGRANSLRFRSLLTRQMSNPESARAKRNVLASDAQAGATGLPAGTTGTVQPNPRKTGHGIGGLFRRQFLICMVLAVFVTVNLVSTVNGDMFDDDCNPVGFRKPPRFGKRSHNDAEVPPNADQLGLDPSAWPDAAVSTSAVALRRFRRADCIRGGLRRRTMRGSPKFIIPDKRYLTSLKDQEGMAGVELSMEPKYSSQNEPKSVEVGSNNVPLGRDAALIARLRSRFPKAFRSLEAVVKEFKALDQRSGKQ